MALLLVPFIGGLFLIRGNDDTITVPDVAGLSAEDAEQTLRAAGLKNIVVREVAGSTREIADGTVEPGRVVGTNPGATKRVVTDTRIIIQTSPDAPPLRWYEEAAEWILKQVS